MERGLRTLIPASVAESKGKEIRVCFDSERDPVKNLIREEELFRKVERWDLPELVRFWVNSECLVRGRARSTRYGWYDELLAEEMRVEVVERSTGGGVVYQDEGNLNWSFFLRNAGSFPSPMTMFSRASSYMARVLARLGVEARFAPPNRIDVFDRKVSGMAGRSTSRALLVHGTLLLNSNLEKLNMLCIPPRGCPPVANVSEWARGVDAPGVVGAVAGVLEDSGYRVLTDSIA
jgi:lipoate-protein ligase A